MARNTISKPTAAAVTYPLNHRATFDYITIQNNTSNTITVTITAQNVQRVASPVYSAPAAGTLVNRCRCRWCIESTSYCNAIKRHWHWCN
jgi:hypothetical protein